MAKVKTPTQYEMAVEAFFDACHECARVRVMFDYAEPAYFELANTQLTVAEMHRDACLQRVKLLAMKL